jgi:RHS repeat-associated protein
VRAELRRILLIISLVLFGILHPIFGQVATGIYPFGSFDSRGVDTINIGNLNVHLDIPIFHKAGRGIPFSYDLTYDNSVWQNVSSNGSAMWLPVQNFGWTAQTVVMTGYLSYAQHSYVCDLPLPQHGTYDVYDTWVYHDPLGVSHSFSGHIEYDPKGCASTLTGFRNSATDNSGLSLVVGSSNGNPGGAQTILTRDGRSMVVPTGPASQGSSITDSNGNQVTVSPSGVYTDTLGTPAMTVAGAAPNNVTFTYPNASGGASSYTAKYSTYTVQTNFGCVITEYPATSAPLISEIDLPDGTKYSFTYEPTTGVSNGAVTGRMASITLPTGGIISYSYSGGCNGTGMNADGSTAILTRTTSDGSKSYTRSIVSASASSTTVQDEKTNQSLYQFSLAGNLSYETHRQIYQAGIGGTPLFEQFSCYNNAQVPCDGSSIALPVAQTTTLASYNGGSQAGVYNTYDSYGMLTSSTQKSGSSVLQATTNTYNALEEVLTSTTTDVYGAVVASSSYGYDETGVSPSSGVPQHIAVSGTRGNQTSAYVSTGSGSLGTITSYYDTGAPVLTSTNSGVTRYGYDPTQTFTTLTTLPTPSSGVPLATSASYDPQSGAQLSATGMNSGQTTQYTQYDVFLRPTGVTLPNGSAITVTYNPNQTGIVQSIGNGANADFENLVDAYGRKSRAAIYNGQSGSSWYQVDYCYDATGLLQFQSLKYQGNGFGAAKQCSGGGTTYSYDALGRATSSSNADGTATIQYFSRAVKTTDVSGVQRIIEYDLLGRVSAVCEISSGSSVVGSGSATACGTDIPGTGFLTTYAYGPGNTTTISQGAQQRIFQTDSAGRVVYIKEPERGVTTYSYVYNSTGLVVTRVRPQANQTNPAVTTTTTTQYDSLGRPVNISYNDGITPNKIYNYDQATNWSNISLGQSMGQLTFASTSNTGTQFAYDPMGNVTQTIQCLPGRCGTANYNVSRSYVYDGGGNLIQDKYLMNASSGTEVDTTYTVSVAGEVSAISNTLGGTANDSGIILANIQNGPTGPTHYEYGNGLNGVNTYDSSGRLYGNWLCSASTQQYCSGGTQVYGNLAARQGSRVTSLSDTALNSAVNLGYDEFNRLTSANYTTTQNAFSFGYDRYGNRWSQNVVQGSGPSPQLNFNAANNQVSGYSYDAAGNLLSDGMHNYTYDAEGNLLQVDAGATATYTYDALNHRVQTLVGGLNTQYVFGINGQRVSTWDGASCTPTLLSAITYWNGRPVSLYNGATYYQHQDVLGTQRLLTTSDGSVAGSYQSLAFGDGLNISGVNNDPSHFAQLDRDSETYTDHAQFRQYSSTQGRWMSPDPYDGSYDPSNPQSFNRYSYVLNNPLAATDPTGHCGGDDSDAVSRRGVRAADCDPGEEGGGGGGGGGDQCPVDACVTAPDPDPVDPEDPGPCSTGTCGPLSPTPGPGQYNHPGNAPSNTVSQTPYPPNTPKTPDQCSIYNNGTASGAALYKICQAFPNSPKSNQMRGCLQSLYSPQSGYIPLPVLIPTSPGSWTDLNSLIPGTGAHVSCALQTLGGN